MRFIHLCYTDHFGQNKLGTLEVIREHRFQFLKIRFAPGFSLIGLDPVRYGLNIRKVKLSVPVLIDSLCNTLASFID